VRFELCATSCKWRADAVVVALRTLSSIGSEGEVYVVRRSVPSREAGDGAQTVSVRSLAIAEIHSIRYRYVHSRPY